MFEMESQQVILDRLKTYFVEATESKLNRVEGGFVFDTLSANAKEFEKAYAEMNLITEAMFPQTSWGIFLTMLSEQFGIIRQEATKAIAELTITGQSGALINKGAIFATNEGQNFLAVNDTRIGSNGSVIIKAEAQEKGIDYNVEANSIVKIPVSIYGIQSVINENPAHDGFDEESDSELLERLLFKMRQPSTSGNVYHYKLWASEVAGVGGIKVIPLWNGNGTVKVIITDMQNNIATDDLIKKVFDHIEEQRPVGATVTVVSPTPLSIKIALKVTNGIGDIEAIKVAVNNYFKDNVFNMNYVSYAQIGKVILQNVATTGVKDYAGLKINDLMENIPLTAEQIPTVSEVILVE